jgi:hypothetical protein
MDLLHWPKTGKVATNSLLAVKPDAKVPKLDLEPALSIRSIVTGL